VKENNIEEDIILLKDFTEGNFKRDKLENYKGSYKMGYFYYKDIQQAIEHILSDYKRALKEVKRYKNMYEAEHQIHLVRNEQLDRKQKAIIKCNELENENKELKEVNEKLKQKIEGQEYIIEKQAHNEEVYKKLVIKLEKENTEFEKLSKDYSYSVDIVRENTRLRRQAFDLELENKKLKNKLLDTLEGQKVIKEETPQYIKENYILKSKLKDIIDRIDYDIKKTKEIISKNTNIYASYRKNDYQIVRLRAMNTKSLDIKNRLQELLELSELNSEFNSEGKSEV
jgi:hypothetical protein